MASWKKMAEAFGRAMAERSKDTPASKVVGKSKTLKGLDKIGSKAQASPEQRAYLEGHEVSGPDNYYAAKERGGDYEKRIEEIEDENSDLALKQNREKEWDDAFKQSSDKFKSQSSALTDEDTDVWRSELLRTIDVLRNRGFSDADILNTIKGN